MLPTLRAPMDPCVRGLERELVRRRDPCCGAVLGGEPIRRLRSGARAAEGQRQGASLTGTEEQEQEQERANALTCRGHRERGRTRAGRRHLRHAARRATVQKWRADRLCLRTAGALDASRFGRLSEHAAAARGRAPSSDADTPGSRNPDDVFVRGCGSPRSKLLPLLADMVRISRDNGSLCSARRHDAPDPAAAT